MSRADTLHVMLHCLRRAGGSSRLLHPNHDHHPPCLPPSASPRPQPPLRAGTAHMWRFPLRPTQPRARPSLTRQVARRAARRTRPFGPIAATRSCLLRVYQLLERGSSQTCPTRLWIALRVLNLVRRRQNLQIPRPRTPWELRVTAISTVTSATASDHGWVS